MDECIFFAGRSDSAKLRGNKGNYRQKQFYYFCQFIGKQILLYHYKVCDDRNSGNMSRRRSNGFIFTSLTCRIFYVLNYLYQRREGILVALKINDNVHDICRLRAAFYENQHPVGPFHAILARL